MIRNIVFDFGNVLIRYEPLYMAGMYAHTEEDARLLAEVVFDRHYWDPLDAGTITDGEVVSLCKERLPERLHTAVEQIYYNWIYNLPEIEGMRALLEWLRDKYGIPLYLLSNISEYFAIHSDEIPILDLFDKCIFSARAGRTKPSKEMFSYLCTECNILPEETLFVDDSEKNIEGARTFGINAYLFDGDSERLKKYIEENFMIDAQK